MRPWNRFYEKTVASDHAHTVLCTAYGRNTQNALRKAHAQAGFQYVRFHALFDDDDAVYTEDAAGDRSTTGRASTPSTTPSRRGDAPAGRDQLHPQGPGVRSDAAATLGLLWYNNASPNISPPTGAADDWGKWTALMTAFVRHLEGRYGAAEVRAWYFEVWNEPSWMYTLGDDGYFELYQNTVTGLVAADPRGAGGRSGRVFGRVGGDHPDVDCRVDQHRDQVGLRDLPPLRRRRRGADCRRGRRRRFSRQPGQHHQHDRHQGEHLHRSR